jgi:hypothetical protein
MSDICGASASSNGTGEIKQEPVVGDYSGGVMHSSRFPQDIAEWDNFSQGFWTENDHTEYELLSP